VNGQLVSVNSRVHEKAAAGRRPAGEEA